MPTLCDCPKLKPEIRHLKPDRLQHKLSILEETGFLNQSRQLGDGLNAKLAHHAAAVRFDGAVSDAEIVSGLLI